MFTIKPSIPTNIILLRVMIITLLLINPVKIAAATEDTAPLALSDIPFTRVTVESGGPSNVWLKTVGDINGDGKTDLIAGGNASGGLVWYESPTWTKRTIASGGGFGTDGEVADMDKDGDNDVVVLTSSDIRWYENPSWTLHVIESRVLHDVEVSDFDGDGDVDLVARNQGAFSGTGNELHFYQQNSPTSWTHRAVNCSNGEGLKVTDVDKDNDVDVIIGGAWFENTKNIVGGAWTSYSYTSAWTNPNAFVSAGDLNKDGRMDIVLAPAELAGGTYKISWLEAPANPKSGNWLEHIVENNVETVVHFVGVADMNNDGNPDIVAAEMQQGNDPDEVKVYMNLDGAGGSWQKQVVAATGSHSMRILDVGNDGDYDLYGANWQGSVVEIWNNNSSVPPVPSPTPAPVLSLDNWQRFPIDSSRPWTALFIKEADIDGDGAKDIVTGGWWYKNPGAVSGVWERYLIGSPLNNMLVLYDFDQDGDTDIFGIDWKSYGGPSNRTFSWARNDGSGNFSIFTNIQTPPNGDFPMGAVVDKFNNTTTEIAIKWHDYNTAGHDMFTVPSDPATGLWTWRSIETQPYFHGHWLESADIDRDGDKDIMSGYFWFRNNGGSPTSWQKFTVFNTTDAAHKNAVVDINKDGRLDVFVGIEAISALGKMAWYEQPATPTNTWTEHIIGQVVGPMSMDAGDMDNDGDVDLIVGEHNLNNPSAARLLIYENLDGMGGSWQQHLSSVGDEHHNGAQLANLDNDGDLDIMSIGWGNSLVLLYENKALNPVFTPTPNSSPSPTATRTPTSTPPSPTLTPNPLSSPTVTGTPTSIPSPTPTVTRSATPNPQPTINMGETNILSENDSGDGGLIVAYQTSLNQPATLQSLSFYVTQVSGHLQLGVYTDAGGNPGNLIVSTGIFTPSVGWNTRSVNSTILPAGNYWLAYMPESSSMVSQVERTGNARWYASPFGSMPATFSTSASGDAYHWSFYATLNTDSTPTPISSPTMTSTLAPGASPTQTPSPLPGPIATRTLTSVPSPTLTSTPLPSPTVTQTPVNTSVPPTPTNTPASSTSTGFLSPSANSAETSSAGDNNGYQTSPTNVYANDSSVATDTNSGTNTNTSCTNSGKEKHRYYNYNLNIPATAVIQGIEVRIDARADSTSGSPTICVQLSWDGGTTWTTVKSTTHLNTTETTYTLGSMADTWSRTWTPGDFSNTNFRLRVINVASNTSRDFFLDYIAVNVSYQP